MRKITLLITCFFLIIGKLHVNAQKEDTASFLEALKVLEELVKKDSALKYQTGTIKIHDAITLNIPKGYKYIGKEDAEDIIYNLWNNPPSEGTLGILVNDSFRLTRMDDWSFVVSYFESGFVKDDDAAKLNYDDMMKEMKESELGENKERVKLGYDAIHILGWATKPFYDKGNNTLHWAKIFRFGDGIDTTLNYDVRILGRKGVLSMNAIGSMSNLADIQKHIPDLLKIATFSEGNKYKDFNPSIDKVAAYTIGGLVAGKILAKAGLIALLLKNIKLVVLGALALFGGFGKKIINFFSRKKDDSYTEITHTDSSNP